MKGGPDLAPGRMSSRGGVSLASLLAIDWDQRRLHLVVAQVQRKGIQVEKALTWDMGEDLTARTADAIGKRLREFLKSSRIGAGQAIVSVGRDRVILKEIRFPAVA